MLRVCLQPACVGITTTPTAMLPITSIATCCGHRPVEAVVTPGPFARPNAHPPTIFLSFVWAGLLPLPHPPRTLSCLSFHATQRQHQPAHLYCRARYLHLFQPRQPAGRANERPRRPKGDGGDGVFDGVDTMPTPTSSPATSPRRPTVPTSSRASRLAA